MAADGGSSERSVELDRIIFFSDAVFAIAATLLVVDLRVPDLPRPLGSGELGAVLLALIPRYGSYAISFLVIGSFWAAHLRVFRYIRRHDGVLIQLVLLLLMFVAFLPFPTAVLGSYGDQRLAVLLYAAVVSTMNCLNLAIWWWATSRHRLVDEDLAVELIRANSRRAAMFALLFLASIPLALLSPGAAELSWLLALVLPRLLARFEAR